VNPLDTIATVARQRGLKVADILGPRRFPELVAARREIAQLLSDEGLSYPSIGRAMNRHHTTAMYYIGALPGRAIPGRMRGAA
jgi:chromosomal replication initiation ATPase DnaA